MQNFIDFLRDFNIYTIIIRLMLALILGGFVGLERERSRQAAGLRTHILVCIAATMSMIIGLFAIESNYVTDPLRIGAQVISGIGFIGAGAILVRGGKQIKGITTASGLWCTASIGLALGIGFYEGAIICSVIVLAVMSLLKNFDKILFKKNQDTYIYLEISGTNYVNTVIDYLKELEVDIYIYDISAPKSGVDGNMGITLKLNDLNLDINKLFNEIRDNYHIAYVFSLQKMLD